MEVNKLVAMLNEYQTQAAVARKLGYKDRQYVNELCKKFGIKREVTRTASFRLVKVRRKFVKRVYKYSLTSKIQSSKVK